MKCIDGKVFEAGNLSGLNRIRHGFFSREGGVSDGDYASLNVGFGSNDVRARVAENRRRVARHLGAMVAGRPHNDVVTSYQVHSAQAVIVDAPFGADGPPNADAIVTATPNLAIGALTADCTPVLFADEVAGVVGAAHAGWRGALEGILGATVACMEELGARRDTIRAAIGPTIHQSSYEVGLDFKAEFLKAAPGNARFFAIPAGGKRDHFDLPGFCRASLDALQLMSVDDVGQCTYENESLFFSYRRKTHRNEQDYGRQIAAIVLS